MEKAELERALDKVRKAVDQDYYDGRLNIYRLDWFQILEFRETRFVVYGQGQWDGHIMDWRGGNFYHGRIAGSPTFKTIEDAALFLEAAVVAGILGDKMTLSGHHSGDLRCLKGCDEREIMHISINHPEIAEARFRKPGIHCRADDALRHGAHLPARMTWK